MTSLCGENGPNLPCPHGICRARDVPTDGSQFRKTKIVCTIGPTSNTREGLWRLADEGMNVARLNMSHGDHASHKAVVDLIREYNKLNEHSVAIMLDTKGPEVRSGDLTEPIDMVTGTSFRPLFSHHPTLYASLAPSPLGSPSLASPAVPQSLSMLPCVS